MGGGEGKKYGKEDDGRNNDDSDDDKGAGKSTICGATLPQNLCWGCWTEAINRSVGAASPPLFPPCPGPPSAAASSISPPTPPAPPCRLSSLSSCALPAPPFLLQIPARPPWIVLMLMLRTALRLSVMVTVSISILVPVPMPVSVPVPGHDRHWFLNRRYSQHQMRFASDRASCPWGLRRSPRPMRSQQGHPGGHAESTWCGKRLRSTRRPLLR